MSSKPVWIELMKAESTGIVYAAELWRRPPLVLGEGFDDLRSVVEGAPSAIPGPVLIENPP
jgi:hypothetical protein